MASDRIPIVNEQDEILSYRDRESVVQGDIYRVASLWVTNSKAEVLLARRAYTKSHDPGKWGPAVAGTVEEDETYESNIVKEAMEELGITGVKFQTGIKYLRRGEKWSYFVQQYYAVIDKPATDFVIRAEEVAEVRWFSKEALTQALEQHPDEFLKSMRSRLEEYIASI